MGVSIIIPTYNRADLIQYTLHALNPALHVGIELETIVIDDGSTDHTIQLVEEQFPHVHLIKHTHKGAQAARNAGLKASTQEFILYLDSDDLVTPGYFAQKIDCLKNHPELDAVYGNYEYFKSDDEYNASKVVFMHKYPMLEGKDQRKLHLYYYLRAKYLPANALLWRKSFLNKIGGHDETLIVNQDVELMIRALMSQVNIDSINDGSFALIREHAQLNRVGSVKDTAKLEAILQFRKDIYKRLIENGYNDPYYLAPLSYMLFQFWRRQRHINPEMAKKFLAFSKQVYWPVRLNNNKLISVLSKLFGPVNAIHIKYFIFRRD
jgi:glycosyltransferase involved in cell wall biosynthesis